jgi:hypothetical protein
LDGLLNRGAVGVYTRPALAAECGAGATELPLRPPACCLAKAIPPLDTSAAAEIITVATITIDLFISVIFFCASVYSFSP